MDTPCTYYCSPGDASFYYSSAGHAPLPLLLATGHAPLPLLLTTGYASFHFFSQQATRPFHLFSQQATPPSTSSRNRPRAPSTSSRNRLCLLPLPLAIGHISFNFLSQQATPLCSAGSPASAGTEPWYHRYSATLALTCWCCSTEPRRCWRSLSLYKLLLTTPLTKGYSRSLVELTLSHWIIICRLG